MAPRFPYRTVIHGQERAFHFKRAGIAPDWGIPTAEIMEFITLFDTAEAALIKAQCETVRTRKRAAPARPPGSARPSRR